MSPNKHHGPTRSVTECDKKQGRSKLTVLTRRERKIGEKSTCREKGKEISGSAEGQELLEDKEIWGNETALRGVIYDSRKRERSNEDGLFMPHQKGPITSTFTVDWFLREGQGRELLKEWMKMTAVSLNSILTRTQTHTTRNPNTHNHSNPRTH
jgi:hypothetical protein